jgi:hypothetical protein
MQFYVPLSSPFSPLAHGKKIMAFSSPNINQEYLRTVKRNFWHYKKMLPVSIAIKLETCVSPGDSILIVYIVILNRSTS